MGRTLVNKLAKLSVTTCADLQTLSRGTLEKHLGPKTGQSLHRFAFGHDDRQLNICQERKSVSAEINYGIRFTKVNFSHFWFVHFDVKFYVCIIK